MSDPVGRIDHDDDVRTEVADVVGFGSVAIDELVRVDAPLAAGKGRVIEERCEHGGNVATALVAAAALGARAAYIGWLSSDPVDAPVAESLSSRGVDLSRARCSPDARPIRSTIVVGSDGERFIAYRDDTLVGAPPSLAPEDFGSARVLMVDAYAANSLDPVRMALAAGLDVVADVEWSSGETTQELLALCQHLVLPWHYAASLAGSDAPRHVVDALWSPTREAVVITCGAGGAWLRRRSGPELWHQSAFDVDVVDTTGCGDWFHGAYAAAFVQGLDALRSVRFAAAAAALAATCPGGRGERVTPGAVGHMLEAAGAPQPVLVDKGDSASER